jgi:hypothetical protein
MASKATHSGASTFTRVGSGFPILLRDHGGSKAVGLAGNRTMSLRPILTAYVSELGVINDFNAIVGHDNPFIMHEESMELRVSEGERGVFVSLDSPPPILRQGVFLESTFQHLPGLGNEVTDGVAPIALRL